MKALLLAGRGLLRERRSGEMLVLLAAVALAVGALTAVGFLTDRIGKAVARQANEVLAADLRLGSPEPVPDAWRRQATAAGLATAETISFPSVVFAGDDSVLTTLQAVTAGYPLRGRVRLADRLFGAERPADGIPPPGEVWADAALLARLDASVGDPLAVGEASLRIGAVLAYRPDQSIGFASLAPSLLLNAADLPATGLVASGSRVRHALLVAGPADAVERLRAQVAAADNAALDIGSRDESSEQAFAAADRAERFLALAALVSLLLAAVAIAMSARRYARRRLDTVALMKSLGASQALILAVSLLQLLALGVVGVALGSIIGFAAERGVAWLLADLLAADLPTPGWRPVGLAAVSAAVLLVGFALPSLLQLRNTPPLRVLRHDALPPAPSAWLVGGLAVGAVALILWRSVGDAALLGILLAGIAVLGALLYAAGRLLVALLGRFRSGVGVAWRYGLANVSRRGRASAVQVVAFGLGIMVLLLLTLVRADLLEGWRETLEEQAPNRFLINIQPDERGTIADLLASADVTKADFAPLVRARLIRVDGVPVDELAVPSEDAGWFLEREQNLSWARVPDPSNDIVAGTWWPPDHAGPPQVSIEEDIADETGIGLGDRLTFAVAGQEVDAEVTSIRRIDWGSFRPNFFLVLSPGALADFPASWIASLRVDPDQRGVLVDLVREFPTVSVIDLEAILAQVRGIVEKASLAIQAVFGFTLAAGVVVLFAAVQSTIDERRLESAMLRALGARRSTVAAGVMAEFAALGLAAGVLAAAGATVLAGILAVEVFDLPWRPDPLLWLAGVAGGLVVVCASGWFAARGAVTAAPADVLRRAGG